MSNVKTNTEDLDLVDVDSTELDDLASAIETFYKADTAQKSSLAYHWEKNHLFLDGKHWLTFNGNRETGGSWEQFTPLPENEYIPQPVTNYIFDSYQTLKGYLLKNKPRITVTPNTQTYKDKTAAMIAELVSEANYERLREAYNYEYAASCLITYGTVFKKDYWDNSYLNMSHVPRTQPQPVIDPQTGQPTGATEDVPVLDPLTGDPVFDELPLGDVSTAVVEPYRIAMDPLAVNLHEARWIMEYSIRPLTWIMENFDKPGEQGYTGRAAEVKEEKSLSNSMRRFYQLRNSSGARGLSGGLAQGSSSGASTMIENAAVVKEYYERPTKKYPKGRLAVVANGIPLYVDQPISDGEEQGDWHPYSECRWEPVPGRFWAKGPFDDATEVNKRVNSIDSIIILTRKTQAIPQKLAQQGMIVAGQWTGRPGQLVFYRPGPNGEKPETIPPSGVDAQVWKEREQAVSDIKALTGAVAILQGDRPPGVTAASAMALLFEVGTGKLSPILDRWKDFIESSQKKQLKLIAKKYREPRPEFIKALVSKNTELTVDTVKSFVGSDLHDNCNVVIEASSAIPKLKAAEQALLLEVQQTGALNLEDPSNRVEFLTRLGITGFNEGYSKDANRAKLENMHMDYITTNPDNKPIVMLYDNDAIHLQVHEDRTKEQSFMDLPPESQQLFFAHIEEHNQAQAQKQQQQMMQAAMMQMSGAPAQPDQSSPPQAEHIRKGSGITTKTKELLGSDMLGTSAGVGK